MYSVPEGVMHSARDQRSSNVGRSFPSERVLWMLLSHRTTVVILPVRGLRNPQSHSFK